MLKKVGFTKLAYSDIIYDLDGWVDAKKYAPKKQDLVKIKTKNAIMNGWHTGKEWFGISLYKKKDKEVLYWKRIYEPVA